MPINFAEHHNWVVSELAQCLPTGESMDRLIDQCEAQLPHPDWSLLRSLPYRDLNLLRGWLETPFIEEPPSRPLSGLWFGLFNPCPDGRTPTADIYVCGSERFHAAPDDCSWAVGPDWWPGARYAESEILAGIYRISYRQGQPDAAREQGLNGNAEYPLCLGYGAFAVRELLAQIPPELILQQSKSLGIGVGFDSGDFVLVGTLTGDGLGPVDRTGEEPGGRVAQALDDLRSTDPERIFRAMLGLRHLGDLARQAIPELLRLAARSREVKLRQFSLCSLANIAPDDPRTKIAALDGFEDPSPFVRREALQAIVSVKDLSAGDIALIQNMAADSDDAVARWSEIALRNIRLRGSGGIASDCEDR